MDNIAIFDTVQDLPKLLAMTPQEQAAWYNSLGDLERAQLARVCSVFVGLHIGRQIVEAMSKAFTKTDAPNSHH